MEKLLSIIVPAYNSASTIDECLSSLARSWLEVIIVNDGSTDTTKQICERYVAASPDVFKLISKENGGHGSALNVGFAAASGKYLGVMDSDDYATDAIESLTAALESDADIIINDYFRFGTGGGKISRVRSAKCGTGECRTADIIGRATIHSLLIRRSLVEFKLTEGCYYDDIQYTLYPFARAVTVYYSGVGYYAYRIGQAGQSVSPKNIYNRRGDYSRVLLDLVRWYADSTKCNDEYVFGCITSALITNYNRYTSFILRDGANRDEIIAFDAALKELYPSLYTEAGKRSPDGYVIRLRKRGFTRTRLYGWAFNIIKRIKGY